MKLRIKEKIIYIEESAIIVLFVCLLSKTARTYLDNYFLCFLFIAFHELSHITVAALLGNSVKRINIRLCGLSVNLENKLYGIKSILVYIAGPFSNIVLATLFCNIKIIFEINVCLALINLVPIKPLDGYNILSGLLCKKNMNVVSKFAEIILIFISVYIFVKYCNISLIFLLLYIKTMNVNSAK